MAKINTYKKQKGLTLIELLLYMSIFSILFLTITSSVFFLQKIIQNNNQNYYIKNQIYTNLNILQQYLYKNKIELEGNDITIFTNDGKLLLVQKNENNQLKNIYQDKNFSVLENIKFTEYNITFLEKDRLLKFDLSWLDNRGKLQNFVEYLIVINSNL